MKTVGHWIGGKYVDGDSGRTAPVTDPATGEVTAEVALASVADVDLAVAAASEAAADWTRSSLSTRTRVLFRYRELLDRRRDEIASLITAEHGKVHADALGEVARGIEVVEFACSIPQLLKSAGSYEVSTGVDVREIRQPLGVVAGITPFNFPAMVPLWMFPMAIACGNSFILKPSEKDPSAALRVADLMAEAGLPPGVLNVVNGDVIAVRRLLEHPDVAAVSFVGSTPVAQEVYRSGTNAGKRVQALGGAKNHMVVLPDADLDVAADSAVSAGYGSAGERCMAVSVVVAVGGIGDELVAKIAERTRGLRIGPGDQDTSDMGPLITAAHRDKVASYLPTAREQGATVVLDGTAEPIGPAGAHFLGASLLDDVTPEMDAYRDEIFGPVLSVVRTDTFAEAMQLVNSSPWGNGAAVFTSDGAAARRFEMEVQAGMVGVNVPIPVPVAYHSFGGWKGSLFGDHHIYGSDSVHFYTRGKVVTSRWVAPRGRGLDLAFPSDAATIA
ncbi:MAG: malonate-semialdehyde dehydrogenase (acetylating) / methylmalonate-semialdehyde dehydrogenase [Pseudonocardiales bacterium]|nr:malonate-semialdehyde dehydrogenase (acetylating) / methylmalonate-semialdehyde dehydrogenase [Pseudonocardiales bacterium]MDT7695905.1 malonate-semialdehyde dehydrogenase (acetylating) / methylmalonate-semialdehyde dehydrogenase [Pseudonocardiales bacterium]